MTEHGTPDAPEAEAAPTATAGMILARERASSGMSIEDVAMQLKLAPRQVVAIERDDFANLPGRTFVRGFVRNYARLLKLDVDAVLAALPGDGALPVPERPLLATTTRAMGELPRETAAKAGIGRWAIPLVLVAIVAVAAWYEFARPQAPRGSTGAGPVVPLPSNAVPLPTPPQLPAGDVAPSSSAGDTSRAAVPGDAGSSTATTTLSAVPSASTLPTSSTVLPNPLANAASANVVRAPAASTAAATAAAGVDQNTLSITFQGASWIEVRDRSGGVVLSMTGATGATRELALAAPGEIIIGNAAVVAAAWRGRPIDIAANSRQNVARIRLD